MEHHHLENMVADIDGVQTFWESKDKPGFRKTDKSTRDYQFLLTNLLSENAIAFDQELFTCTKEKDVPSMLAMLQDEMNRYHWAKRKATDEVMGTDKCKLTGKIGNSQDDLLVALMMGIYVMRLILLNPARLNTS